MSLGGRQWIYAAVLVLVGLVVWLAWNSATKGSIKHYPLTGTVVAVHPESGTATVHNDNMPGFMEPMDMDYQVKDRATLPKLKAGDRIRATLRTDARNMWELENITVTKSQ
jgi:Cu/Ag efflux protein CusF